MDTKNLIISNQHYLNEVNNLSALIFFKKMLKIRNIFWIKRIKALFHNVIINSNANLTNSIAIANTFNKISQPLREIFNTLLNI